MKRTAVIIWALCLHVISNAAVCQRSVEGESLIPEGIGRPYIHVSDSEKEALSGKIASQAWAKEAFGRIKAGIDPYVERHVSDPEWIVSRLAMYWKEGERYTQCYLKKQNWDYGEGNAPVPTVRMPGMRTWNRYNNVPLEERTPYNETGDMWGLDKTNPSAPKVLVPYKESGHMIRGNNVEILTMAENAAFLYWFTDDEKYARFASDIFYTWLLGTYYMNPILDPEQSTGSPGGYAPGGICGYYDYEQIHDDLAMHAAVIYDFAYDYLKAHPSPHLAEIGKDLKEVTGTVFKRFIDLGMVRGDKKGNWNVNGWNMILRPILALEEDSCYADGKGRGYYIKYLTDISTQYHNAIPDILKVYDPVTGLWPESPGYAFSVIDMLLDFSVLLRRRGIDIIEEHPLLQKAALAVLPWMDGKGNMINFGDARGGSVNYKSLETLLAYYSAKNDTERIRQIAPAISLGLQNGSHKRSEAGWSELLLFVPEVPDCPEVVKERVSYSPFHRVVTMKSSDGQSSLMSIVYGGRKGSHLSRNGLALQLYGSGYALAPDAAAYESYWSPDYDYHQSVTGSNTIIPGYSHGEIEVNLLEPGVSEGSFAGTCALNPNINVSDISAAEKRRVNLMIKTGDSEGYYVDIFRSRQEKNDYLFHNVGLGLELLDTKGNSLPTKAVDAIDPAYHSEYKWFTDIQKVSWGKDFIAEWTVTEGEKPLRARLWLPGGAGREIFKFSAPYTTVRTELTPDNISTPPGTTPSLIARQDKDAWEAPYIGVYHTFEGEKPVVSNVRKIVSSEDKTAIRIDSQGGRRDYILCGTSPLEIKADDKTSLNGSIGVICEVGNSVEQLYMLDAVSIRKGSYSMEADTSVSASVYKINDMWYYSSDGDVLIRIGDKKFSVGKGYNLPLE